MSLRHFIHTLWIGIANLWHSLSNEVKKYAPITISLLENIKNFEDTGIPDIITALIPGGIDDAINAQIKLWLPKIIIEAQLVNSVANITDTNEQLRIILNNLKVSSDEVKKLYYHGLASLILEKISDGKFSWSDATAVAEYYFKNRNELQQAA